MLKDSRDSGKAIKYKLSNIFFNTTPHRQLHTTGPLISVLSGHPNQISAFMSLTLGYTP